jgi:pyruvate-formate lyase-activating enzyme
MSSAQQIRTMRLSQRSVVLRGGHPTAQLKHAYRLFDYPQGDTDGMLSLRFDQTS